MAYIDEPGQDVKPSELIVIQGLAFNGNEVNFININDDIEIDGNLNIEGDIDVKGDITTSETSFKIVTFADGTDEEIAAMLNAHYRGDINIEDYWHVGDTRQMNFSAIEASEGGESWNSYTMPMVIIGINHDDLTIPINGKTKAAITIHFSRLHATSTKENYGDEYNWYYSPRRFWLNNTFIKSIPLVFQPLIKTVIKKNLNNHRDAIEGPNTEDKVFLLSSSEVFDESNYKGTTSYWGDEEIEGKKYEYFTSDSLRIRKCPVYTDVSPVGYWLRSPDSTTEDSWCVIDGVGKLTYYQSASNYKGLAPAFCL